MHFGFSYVGLIYPPRIQERVKSLEEYRDKIPTQKNKLAAKLVACLLFVVVLSLILRFVNGCTTFLSAFGYGFLLWTIVNTWMTMATSFGTRWTSCEACRESFQ